MAASEDARAADEERQDAGDGAELEDDEEAFGSRLSGRAR